ncbi:MAG TPA: D-aminoacylase [Pirellulales bacterium]|nr:D-aminoacylase [Pirellulales bacterium]
MFDLVIKSGTVIDGTGSARFKADVAIAGGRIAAVGDLGGATTRHTLDASRLVVAPGFIDVHTHADGWLLTTPNLVPKTSQGITTEILMSDGISYAPVTPQNYRDWFTYLRALNGLAPREYQGWRTIGDYLALLDRRAAQNVATQIPYANVRVLAAGWRRGTLDDTQAKIVDREIRLAMDAGAVGISTGLDYISECFATTDELVAACRAMAPWRGLYATHVRYKKGTLAGVKEAVEIGRRAGVSVHISHLKPGSPQEGEEILNYVDRVAVKEVDFSFDVYPYLAGSTMLHYLLPYEVWEEGPLCACARLREPDVRERFAALLACFPLPLEQVLLAWTASKAGARLVGSSVAEIAARWARSPAEAMCDLLIEENLAALCLLAGGSDEWIEPFLQHPKFMLGTDGIHFADGLVHPRVYGSTARMLGPLVRERKLFSLEAAVRKMTGAPAERFGLIDRGAVREGAAADLVLFDPITVADRATYAEPRQLSLGIEHVLVGGVEIFAHGQAIEDLGPEWPGRALRFNVGG